MIDCNQFRTLAGDLLEGTENRNASEHAAACARCRTLLADLKTLTEAVQSLPDHEPRPKLWHSLRERALAEGLWQEPATVACREFTQLAGDLLEGEEHLQASAHLAACLRCQSLMHDLNTLVHASHTLPVYDPPARVWRRLRQRAVAEGLWQQESWWGRWAFLPQPTFASALAALLLVVSLGLVNSPLRFPLPEYGTLSDAQAAHGELVTEDGYATRYQIHLIQVERAVLDENTSVHDDMIALAEKPLNTVDQAIERTRLALSESPGNLLVQNELNRLYLQKAAVLQTMTDSTWQEYGE